MRPTQPSWTSSSAVPYTRSHDYKYYQIHQSEVVNQKACYICREYPADFEKGGEVYYPVNNDESEALYQKYVAAVKEKYPNINQKYRFELQNIPSKKITK